MIRRIRFLFLAIAVFLNSPFISGEVVDSTSFTLNPRFSFYSVEKSAEILLHVPRNLQSTYISAKFRINNDTIAVWKGIPGRKLIRIPFEQKFQPFEYKLIAEITAMAGRLKFFASSEYLVLDYKPNEVKTDRLTGGLIVNKKKFFPFGFYCYSPVYPTLPEEEVVKGFNLISPYQKILPETFHERRDYMDRCAELGMKVNYNILSVSGGGGVNSMIEDLKDIEKYELLVNEINAFRDHPALLAWYIADEPNGYGISPDSLQKIYKIIKQIDPWHPVSIVFMSPFMSSRRYSGALDIVMADPYPIPDLPVTFTGNTAASLSSEFSGKKPVWIVPQAFGGGELWLREPTPQEIRSMTYQSIINGARGIQYFVRQGLNLFPKSTAAWGECGRMAVEIAELTPWLLSDEETIPVISGSEYISASSYIHKGKLLIMAVNKTNTPRKAEFKISGPSSGRARVLFENRNITVNSGYFSDYISAFGSQAYQVDIKSSGDTIKVWKENMIKDPGFEDTSSPGVPASCYARNGDDRGATYFLDSRDYVQGNHSVRLVTPTENGSIRLRFFPVPVRAGRTYYISIRGKTDPELGGSENNGADNSHYFEISLGEYGTTRFELTGEWKEFVTSVTIPYDIKELPPKSNVVLQMPSAGVGWFDLLQVIEGVDIKRSVNPELDWRIIN